MTLLQLPSKVNPHVPGLLDGSEVIMMIIVVYISTGTHKTKFRAISLGIR